MKFNFNASPNLRQAQSTKRIMLELMIGLLVVFAFSLVYYNNAWGMDYAMQAVKLMVVSLVVALVTESAWAFFTKKENKFDLTYLKNYLSGSFGWITAIILTLMCKIDITPYALGVSTFFAIFFAKLLFGGFGNNIFNPAAVGRAIVFATFMGATTDVVTSATPTTMIASEFNWLVIKPKMITEMMEKLGGFKDLFIGWYPGAIGETSALIILLVGVVLAIRKVIDWRVPTIYLGSIFVLTAAIALMRGVGSYNGLPGFIWYPLLHVLTGGVVFGAIFMLTDPVTSPTSAQGRCIFALGAAIITVLIRVKANLPEGCLYSILMMNMLTPMIEKALEGKQLVLRKKASIIFGVVAVVGLGATLLAGSVVEAKEPAPQVFVSTKDADVDKFKAEVTEQFVNSDGSTTYRVKAQGYASIQKPDVYNEFEIIVKDKKIVSLTPTKVNDTEYVGDRILAEDFTKQFKDADLTKDVQVEVNDVVTGATFSTKSAVRAVKEVQNVMGN
ncbi:NADH:quinone oxidoreductase [Absiella sp. AM54-8XD]|uniref:RnfABCDGE type electron transport complex subunit D n=1 Tax=Absiella sp. AM54-8XD TaxID=2292279 RepID=UPI000E42432E|nr:RnfABCDGE type electron transport complex subunit D [Absiella sp. AM54-8XD]RGC14773.1 NADH:quinone oxidoreductase [Absiella sp. AM54-8XD]